ncbi:hypothetical protein BEH94_06335 [Candidatus Altiarchaeales archaeon WOR_SM1_SCG]|nr:hypothetical protein BEH94_06335 [Candidatus Altiarchaeales archaeon WOR_SM1_SCG]
MPGFNGTGPRGLGPMTGGGRGFCAVPVSKPTSSNVSAEGQQPLFTGVFQGIGFGRGRGSVGRGMGRRGKRNW